MKTRRKKKEEEDLVQYSIFSKILFDRGVFLCVIFVFNCNLTSGGMGRTGVYFLSRGTLKNI